jgi:hypothetical protein
MKLKIVEAVAKSRGMTFTVIFIKILPMIKIYNEKEMWT